MAAYPASGHSQIDVKGVKRFRLGRPTSLEIGIGRTAGRRLLAGTDEKPIQNVRTRSLGPDCSLEAMIRHSSGALDHDNADVVGSFGEIQSAPFDRLENLFSVFMFDAANRIFELLGKVWFFAPRMLQ